jgi:hypothetical protein
MKSVVKNVIGSVGDAEVKAIQRYVSEEDATRPLAALAAGLVGAAKRKRCGGTKKAQTAGTKKARTAAANGDKDGVLVRTFIPSKSSQASPTACFETRTPRKAHRSFRAGI